MTAQVRREKTLKTKIDELTQIRKQLENYVDQLTILGTSWIKSQEGSYQDIREQLESSVDLLFEVLDKMVGAATTSGSSTLEARAGTSVTSGTTLEEILNRMDALENGGNAVLNQVGQMEETIKSWVHEKNESERRLTETERRLARSEARQDQVEERLTKSETQFNQVDKRLAMSEGRLQQLEKWRQEERKETDELCVELGKISASTEGGAVGAGPLLSRQEGQGFVASMPVSSQPVGLRLRQIITCLSDVSKNIGGHYNPSSGTYTVPVSGRYKITLSHAQCVEGQNDHILLEVRCKPGAGWRWVRNVGCGTSTWGREYEYCGGIRLQDTSKVQEMLRAGDRLWVEVRDIEAGARLTAPCGFSCELLEAD